MDKADVTANCCCQSGCSRQHNSHACLCGASAGTRGYHAAMLLQAVQASSSSHITTPADWMCWERTWSPGKTQQEAPLPDVHQAEQTCSDSHRKIQMPRLWCGRLLTVMGCCPSHCQLTSSGADEAHSTGSSYIKRVLAARAWCCG